MNSTNGTEPEFCSRVGFLDEAMLTTILVQIDYFLLFALFVSNCLQVYVIGKAMGHIRRATSDQCMHIFLLSMTLGDFMLTAICYPIEVLTRNGLMFTAPRVANMFVHFLTWTALSGSSLSLVLLNLDKLIYFKYPLRYASYVTKRRGVLVTCAMWACCMMFVGGNWLFGTFKCRSPNCEILGMFTSRKVMYLIFMVTACIAPTVTSLTVACYIARIVGTHRKRLSEEQALYATSSNSHALTNRMKTFYFIFMATIFTACTLLPYRIISCFHFESSNDSAQRNCVTILFLWLNIDLVSLNAILNPLITVTVLPPYRHRLFKKLIGQLTENTRATQL